MAAKGGSREVTCGFLVLCLLFCEMSREGNDIVVDLLLAGADVVAVSIRAVGCHFVGSVVL
jgi:hypothetical protein